MLFDVNLPASLSRNSLKMIIAGSYSLVCKQIHMDLLYNTGLL